MNPDRAKRAVHVAVAEVGMSHEAAIRVIMEAVRICIDAGMTRRATAAHLGVPARRITKTGHYIRNWAEVRSLFRGAMTNFDYAEHSDTMDEICARAWDAAE